MEADREQSGLTKTEWSSLARSLPGGGQSGLFALLAS